MIRPSKQFVIKNKDLVNGKVRVKHYKDLIEYWIYHPKETSLYSVRGRKLTTDDLELASIIVSVGNDSRFTSKDEEGFTLEGFKFTNDAQGNDLQDYLSKTGRS